jgi:pimeloyl-ACP methyl ester carboxylesterase
MDGGSLLPGIQALASAFEVCLCDLRGHGRSPAGRREPRQPNSAATDALDIADCAATLGTPAPIAYGHSFGGIVVLKAAASRPGVFRGVIAASCPLYTDDAEIDARIAAAPSEPRYRVDGVSPEFNDYLNFYHELPPDVATRESARAAVERYNGEANQAMLAARDDAGDEVADWDALLAAVRCPVLLLPAANDPMVFPDRILAAADRHAHVSASVVPEARHEILADQPWLVLQAVRDFAAGC